MQVRLASLISGSGTTMQAIIKASQSGELLIEIACIISSDPSSPGLIKARELKIPERNIVIINPDDFRNHEGKMDQDAFGRQILKELADRRVTVVTQNGWLPLTPKNVIENYEGVIFNQHPGPVPEFGGKGMYGRRVLASRLLFVRMTNRDFFTEAVAQRVDKDFDKGVVVKSARIEILPEDTVEDLQKRVLPVEHKVQIELLKDVAKGTAKDIPKKEALVRPDEEQTLDLAKRMAMLLYPKG